ncbi:ABC transporter substrate-binding protein [Alkalimarinus sediminis]|uniref:ABC transporter substrate-binding protein n=1 Tax=Alkalimarinus sediminis TaxID=1632866 RepID=A0A9E8HI05_9ALTE|nr:ABC transporter substrate-binding protein [Alkalimarinus sediminis]UZW74695.1 ABC transporter substrate-binding protein [Alkalimarinus sediminis]
MFRVSSQHILFILAILLGGVVYGKLDIHAEIFNDSTLRSTIIKGEQFPKILVDAIGEDYPLNHPPKRIVSATLGTDEILSALVDHERMAGVTYLADVPSMSNIPHWYPDNIPRVQGEAEEILSLEPDLVFVAAYTRAETVRLLLRSNIPVVRLRQYDSFSEVEENIMLVAQITGTEAKATSMLNKLHQSAQVIEQKVNGLNRPRVLYYSLDGYTVGSGTKINEMIEMAGGYNVINDTDIKGAQKISEEMALGLEPEIILVNGWGAENSSPSELLAARTAWQNTPAVINRQVHDLQGVWLLSVSQYSWDGIEEMARLIHPEVFE